MFRYDTLLDYFLQSRDKGLLCASHMVSPVILFLTPTPHCFSITPTLTPPLAPEPAPFLPTAPLGHIQVALSPTHCGYFPVLLVRWRVGNNHYTNFCSLLVAFLTFLVYSKTVEIFYFWLLSWPLGTSLPSCPSLHPTAGFHLLLDGLCFTSGLPQLSLASDLVSPRCAPEMLGWWAVEALGGSGFGVTLLTSTYLLAPGAIWRRIVQMKSRFYLYLQFL